MSAVPTTPVMPSVPLEMLSAPHSRGPVPASTRAFSPHSFAALLLGRALPVCLFAMAAAGKLQRAQQAFADAINDGAWSTALNSYVLATYDALSATFLIVVAALMTTRKSSVLKLRRPLPQVAALMGSYIMTLVAVQSPPTEQWVLTVVGGIMLAAGMAGSVVTLLVLGRCFGILPEARGLVTSGPYSLVRHPLYSFEALAFLGLLLPVLSPSNLVIFCVYLALQALRTRYEEEVLQAAFPEYAAYRRSTWRFLPGVW